MGAITIAGMSVSTFITVASIGYQLYSANKMKKKMKAQQAAAAAEAEKRKGFKLPIRGEITYLPVAYGKQMLGGVEAAHRTNNTYPGGSGGTAFSNNFSSGSQSGSKNEFLGVQTALCHSGIEGVVDVDVNESRYNYTKAKFNHRFHTYSTGGTADSASTNFGFPSTNKFSNCAWVSGFYKLDRDEVNYNGIPQSQFILKGQKIHSIVRSGSVGNYTYALSASKTFSNNPALVLLDYLISSEYGRGLPVVNNVPPDIDLETFYHAAEVCNTTVRTAAVIGGRVNGVKPFQEYSSLSQFPNITSGTSAPADENRTAEDLAGYIYKATDTGIFYSWSGGSYSITTVNTRNLPLYECNMSLDTSASIRENIESILDTMGLAELTWSSEGKYKLLLEYPTTAAQTLALVAPEHRFTEDDVVNKELEINWPAANDRYNQVTVQFANEHEDFKEDSITFPKTGSSVHNTFLTEDNQQPFTADISGAGITDPYHALAKAEQEVRQSREMKTMSITVGTSGFSLEPGDYISLYSSLAGIGASVSNPEVFKIFSVKFQDNLTVKLEAYCFKHTMLAWNVNDDIAYVSPPEFDFTVDEPTNFSTTPGTLIGADGTVTPYVDVTWNHTGAYQFELQYKKTTDSNYTSVFTRLTSHRILNTETGVDYDIRVRASNASGITSAGYASATTTVTAKTTNPGVPTFVSGNVVGIYKGFDISWTPPNDKDYSGVEIWESPNNIFSNAVKVGTSIGSSFVRNNLGTNVTKFYWIRSVDTTGNFSAYVGPQSATTEFIDNNSFETGIRDLFEDQGLNAIVSVSSLPTSPAPSAGDTVFLTTDGKLYRYSGSAWVVILSEVDGADITGTISGTQISDNAITTNKIAANAITGSKITANTITGGLLATSGIISQSAQINNGVISNAQIGNLAVDAAKISDLTVSRIKIVDGAVADLGVTSGGNRTITRPYMTPMPMTSINGYAGSNVLHTLTVPVVQSVPIFFNFFMVYREAVYINGPYVLPYNTKFHEVQVTLQRVINGVAQNSSYVSAVVNTQRFYRPNGYFRGGSGQFSVNDIAVPTSSGNHTFQVKLVGVVKNMSNGMTDYTSVYENSTRIYRSFFSIQSIVK